MTAARKSEGPHAAGHAGTGHATAGSASDTQWPRWEVFKQDGPSRPHQAVGSVHATDPEHALVTARNVFARRPAAVSMWVAPADAIFARTLEQLEADPVAMGSDDRPAGGAGERAAGATRTYLVFRKSSHRRSMTFGDHVGQVEATGPEAALRAAIATFDDAPALAWWLVEERLVARSDEGDVDTWFGSAIDKTYKQQSAYGTIVPKRAAARGGKP
jgi:ring-1,2-phenylacetyl-CoA epoxidase subunit PaaB